MASPAEPIVQFTHVSKSFGDVTAVPLAFTRSFVDYVITSFVSGTP